MSRTSEYTQKKNESNEHYKQRMLLTRALECMDMRNRDSSLQLSTEEYKDILNTNHIPFVEIEFEKENNKKVHMVIPECQFVLMSSAKIGKLLKGVK